MVLRQIELNGGLVKSGEDGSTLLELPSMATGYANAQIDDYGLVRNGRLPSRKNYPWQPGTRMYLRARFSHDQSELSGTAGFGFWNAPWGDPTIRWPALPQATWFFFASAPNHLPFAPPETGCGWFAATMDASTSRALLMLPIAPLLLLLNQPAKWRRCLWPAMQRCLGVSHTSIQIPMHTWHNYKLIWRVDGCTFMVDDKIILQTPFSPKGPLGFVCWIDNQYLVATANGRFKWGIIAAETSQWLEVADLQINCLANEFVAANAKSSGDG